MRVLAFLAIALVACGSSSSPEPAPSPTPYGATVDAPPEDDAPPPPSTTTPPGEDPKKDPTAQSSGAHSLKDNRDRLIDTLAKQKSKTRCDLWTSLSATQKGVFLTISDLLGKRSVMTTLADEVTALDHIVAVYEIRDKGGFGNGGGDNNRIWLKGDATLLAALRSFDGALPEWAASKDLAGAHSPFDATSETLHGQPRGQAHFWSADDKAKPLGRPGVEAVNDPHVIEIDIDYDVFHQSNPEGSYVPGGYGRTFYESVWKEKGKGGSAELDYVPTGCN